MTESRSEQILRTVRSHLGRAREGRKLVEQGKPLSELSTPLEGPSEEYLLERRAKYIESMEGLDEGRLRWVLGNIEYQIDRREQTPEAGTSELHWMRNVITGLLGD